MEYLPSNYKEGTTQKFPVVIFLHGIGEEGDGNGQLTNLMNCWGAPPQMIRDGMQQPAIILSPQSGGWWDSNTLDAFVKYVYSTYGAADPSRLYMTGLSMGGGGVWDYALAFPKKLAAIAPICGATWPTDRSADYGMGVWAFHAADDGTVGVGQTIGNVDGVTPEAASIQNDYYNNGDQTMLYNASNNTHRWNSGATYSDPTHSIPVRATIYSVGGHGIWNRAYSNPDMWNWMWTWTNSNSGIVVTPPPSTPAPTPVPTPVPVARSPYLGAPAAIPGIIEAENYDNGGEGVGYHDDSAGSFGGQYRNNDVDIEAAYDSAGGQYNIGWINGGEWLEYSVNVASTGTYSFEARVASPGSPGQLQILMDGSAVTSVMNVPATGDWHAWQNIQQNVSLTAGTHTMRIAMVNGGFNLNFVKFTAVNSGGNTPPPTSSRSPYTGVPANVPGQIEAENFDRGAEGVTFHDTSAGNTAGAYRNDSNVDIEATGDVGGGFNVGWIDTGEWLEYTVNVASSGYYNLAARIAAVAPSSIQFSVDGSDWSGSMSVPITYGYQTYTDVTKSGLYLSAGTHVIRCNFTGTYYNINFFKITSGSGTVTPPPATPTPVPATPTPTPVAVAQTIAVDFGSAVASGWNNGSKLLNASQISLNTTTGSSSGYSLATVTGFNGVNTDGTASASSSLGMPAGATQDSFFGNDVSWSGMVAPQAVLELRGLDPSRKYTLEFFASRMVNDGSNRETQYDVSGANSGSARLNAVNNTTNVVSVTSISPSSNGVIRITIHKGSNNNNYYGFFYLGNMRIKY